MTTTLSSSPLTASKLNASSLTAILRHHSAKMICSLAVLLLFAASVVAQTSTFNYSGSIVNYTVPAGVTKVTISTKGAQGGNAGGLGASMQGDFSVTPGQVLKILVGGQGNVSSGNSGGGGGSFVTTSTNTPLIIAGGGGGSTCGGAGLPGVTSTNGTNGSSNSSGYGGGGGINGGGGGGSAGRYGAAAGGAGLVGNGGRGVAATGFFSIATGGGVGGNGTNGGDGTSANGGSYTGISNSFSAGGAPGNLGGFGGGGGVYLYDNCYSGAGGGGYSGGGGSYSSGGGGGGSFNSGTNQVNASGVRSGNGVVTITPVSPGAAINFDGVDDYLRTTSPFYQYTNSITVEAWINTTQSVWMGQSAPDVDNWSNSNVWLWHIKAPGQGMDWYVNDGGTARGISLNTLSSGWHHIATTANACGMFIYVDGVLAVSSNTGITNGILNVSNSVIDYGKDPRYSNVIPSGTDRYTSFSVDEVRIWSRSLSIQEINAHKSCELVAGQMTGLQEYYQFNQGFTGDDNTAITTVTDASGNARNASINNLARTGTTSNFISPGGVTTGSNCSAFSLAAITGNGPLSVGGNITLANATAGGTWSSSVSGVATVNASGVVTGVSAGTTVISYTIDCGTAATVTVTVSVPATALKFDPSLAPNDNSRLNYVSVDNPFRTYQKEMTVEFWMYTANANLPFGSVMGQGANNDPQNTVWLMHPNDNGTMTFYVSDGGVLKATTANIIAGGWHHYAGVASATSTRFYVDGVLVHTGPGISGNILNNLTSVIHIGKDVRFATRHVANNDLWNRYATITLDELRIWNRALCAEEIMNNKNGEINPVGQTGLQQYYRFNQGLAGANNTSITTLTDLSGNNRNGTLNNFTLNGANSNWVTSGSTNTGIVNAFVPPAAPITGVTSICTGAGTILANANAGGVWTSNNTAVATVNATTGAVNGVSAGTATITYTTACGGVSTLTFTVKPIPVVTIAAVGGTSTCPGSFVTLNANASVGSTYQWSKDGVAISGAVNASYNATSSGSYTVVVVNNGCTSVVSNAVVVTVADVQPPSITCPANISVPATSLAGAVVNYVTPVGTDNCSGATTVRTSGPVSGSVFPIGTTTVIHTVSDGAGLTASCTFTVTVIGALPVIVCPANITVSNSPGQCNATVNFAATETTGTPASTITYSIAPGSVFPVGTTAVTATATNALGSSSCTFTVTVTATDTDGDGVPDACDADADNDGITNALECNKSNFFWSTPPTVNGSTATGTINGIGYTYTSSSAVGTTSSMYAHATFPASYGVPNANPTIANTQITNNTITFASPMTNPTLVFASIGNSNSPVSISFGAPIQIVWSKDVTSNTATNITGREGYAIVRMMGTFTSISFNYEAAENWCNFAFGADFQSCGDTDNDGTPDYLDTDSDGDGCPDAIEGSMSFSMSQLINGRLTGGVNSQGIPLLAGSGQTIGTSQNNVVNCFCQPGLDETPPTVITKNITVNLNASGNVTINASQVDNGSTDNCGIASITVSKTSFTCSNLGANTVSLTVTDTDGNVNTATATVTVVDAIAPTVTCPTNQILNLDAACNAILPDYRSLVTATDNCTAPNALVVTQSPAAGTTVNSKGALIVTFTVTDASNNSSTCTITVDKKDVTAPVMVCTAPITVNNTTNTCGAVVTFINPTATDNCSGAAFNFWNAGEPNNYQNANEDYVQLYTNATWNDLPDWVLNRSIVEFNSIISTNFANYNLIGTFGGHTYYVSTVTATWLNSRTAAQAIGGDLASINTLGESQFLAPYGGNTWVGGYQDKTVPGFQEPGNASQNYLGWKWVDGTSLGAGQIVITQTAGLPSGSVFPVGVTTNTFTARDESGNTSTCSFTVTVRDAQPPVITCSANRTVNATSAAGAVVNYTAPVGTDNCPGATTVRTAGPASGSVFPIGNTTVTHTVTDAAGTSVSCSFTVTVVGVAPVVVCPANITVNNDPGQCGAVVNFAATETTGIPASTITYSIASGSFFNLGETTVTATATNAVGTSTCTFTVRVNDTQVPTVITQNVTVYLDNNGQASITPAQVNNGSTDNCGIATITVSPNTFTCDNVSSLVNISTQTIVSDNTWAESTTSYSTGNYCISNVWNGIASPLPTLSSYTVIPTINAYSITPIAGTQGLYGQSGVRFFRKTFTLNTLTDIKAILQVAMDNGVQIFINGVAVALKGNMGNTFNGANPVKAVLNSTGANVNGGVGGQAFDNITNTNASSLFVVGTNEIVLALANCDGTDRGAISFKAVIETNNGGPRPVVLTVTDVNGNTATAVAQVTVVDAIDPVLTCQGNIEVFATSASGATVNYVVPTATDNCSAVVTRTAGLASGATFPIGTTTVTHTATDPSGNSVTCSFTVTVTGLPPVITCPANVAVTSTAGQCGTVVNFAATEATAIPASTIVYTENGNVVTSGSFFTVGTHTITATATNPVGSSVCTFTITVTDTETPVIITPANIAVNNDAGVCGAQISITAPAATDNCGIASVIGVRTDGLLLTAVYPVGVTGILWTATDVNGLTTSHTQTVTVTDNEAPVVITNNITIQLDANGNASITTSQINNGSTDNCGIATISLDKTSFNCSNVGANMVTLTVTDIHGNQSIKQATITVKDLTAAIVVAQDITVPLSAAGTASITAADIDNGSTDACGILSMTVSQNNFTCANIGANTVTLTVTDVNGNVSSATAIVTIVDQIAPTVITNNITIQLSANGTASITPAQINNGSTDNCTIASYSLDKTSFNCANVGANTVTLTVTDVNGNSATQTAIVTVVDQIAPTVLTNNMTIQLDANGAAAITTAQINNNSTDNCSIATYSLDKTSFDCSNVGQNTVTLTVTDVNGNSASQTATVTVIDNLAPIVTAAAAQVFCANASGSTQYTIPVASATDNCSIATVTYAVTGATSRTGTGYDASGAFSIGTSTITWTVSDVNGNTSTSSSSVVVNPLPVATYVSSNADAFCNQTSLTAASSITPSLYSWSASNTPGSFSTNPVLSLGLTNADGNYYLYTQSSVTGCVSAGAAVYNFQKQNLSSSYTILAYKEVELGKYNKVLSGSVGVMTAKGEAEFKSYSGVTGAGSFVKAPKIDKDGSGITLNSQIIGIAAVTLPTMQYNTASTNSLPSLTASQNNATLSGNYKNLTVKKGISVTVSGNTFGNIRLEEGASIRFTSTVLNIENFTADRGAKNNDYTYIRFAPNTSVRVGNKVSIGSQVLVNPESYKVSFYMGDDRKDEEKFTVKGGDTRVIANILMPNGKLRVTATDSDYDDDKHGDCDHKAHNSKDCKHKGHEHNDCNHSAHAAANCQDDVYMTGLFIAEEVESKGNKVIWNSYDCSAPAAPITSVNSNKGVTQSVSEEKVTTTSEEELKVTVMPNPSTTYFTLKLESKYETPVNLRVMDGAGRVVDARSKLGSNSTLQIGHSYSSGTYYAELIQGTKRKVVQLIKARG